jgi:peptide chain release factor subunit 1
MITAQAVDRILCFDGDGLPVVSLYVEIPPDPGERAAVRSRLHSLVHEVRQAAEQETLDRESRLSLRRDAERIEEAAAHEVWKPPARAIFSCSRRDFFEQVPLPRRLRDRVMVDATPWVRPMVALVGELRRYCVVVLDSSEAQVWELYQEELVAARRLRDRRVRNRGYAGWHGLEEYRVRNRADELARVHYRRLAAELDALFLRDRFDLLVLGGHHEELERFRGFLSGELARRVAGTFAIDPHTATPDQVRRHADEIADRYERDEERRLVREALDTAAAGGRAAVGLEPCLFAGSLAAVRLLLVHEGASVPGAVCDRCGLLSAGSSSCALCGHQMRATPDVIDDLVETVIDEGGAIEHVHGETELAEKLVAALLRFPLPAPPS